jgi:manganese transport protein
MGAYVVLPTSAICGFLLPIAYVGWLILNNRSDYLGADKPRGVRAIIFNLAMATCIAVVLASVTYSTLVKLNLW